MSDTSKTPQRDWPLRLGLVGVAVALTIIATLLGESLGNLAPTAGFALTGFANLSSIGIQLGGIGSLPHDPEEQTQLRGRLAKLGLRALFGGLLATILNATVAGIILEF